MPAGVPPWMLPGGMAMVRGGRFVIDADECCCEEGTSTTTTTLGPEGCKDPADCTSDCAASYAVVVTTGPCLAVFCPGLGSTIDCGGTYVMTRVTNLDCTWNTRGVLFPFPPAICECHANLTCIDGFWGVSVTAYNNRGVGQEGCAWRRTAYTDCPTGVYPHLPNPPVDCATCAATVTVYS